MSYRQYTHCVDIADFDYRSPLVQAALVGLYTTLPVAVIPVLIAIASGGADALCLLLLGVVYAIAAVAGYCYWWLYRRLICIPEPPEHPADGAGDHTVIGMLIDILPPATIDQFPDIDNDYSIGILPCPNPIGATNAQVAATSPFGYLVAEQPVTRDHGLLYTGHNGIDHEFRDHPELNISTDVLHCEFEGRAVFDMFIAARFALLPAVAAVFACLMPGLGWVVAAILALLALLALAVGFGLGHVDQGSPGDSDPGVSELHTNDEHHEGADTLVIRGKWVYDSGHRFPSTGHIGFYELHPVTFATKTSACEGDVILLRHRWGAAIDDAASPDTITNQGLPQNQWQVHPAIDGCQPIVIL